MRHRRRRARAMCRSVMQADTIGDPATLRNLSICGNAGTVAVPPGTYGQFSVAGRNVLVFGDANSQTPTVYNLEELTLTGSSELRLAGPIVLTVKNRVTLSGSTLGAAADPKRLLLKIATPLTDAEDALKVSGSAVLYGIVRAPQGTITIEGTGRVRGTVSCNYLFVNGNGVLQITEADLPPPPVNRPPIVDAGGDQSITLPTNQVSLNGTASDDGLPQGSVLALQWSVVSGPGIGGVQRSDESDQHGDVYDGGRVRVEADGVGRAVERQRHVDGDGGAGQSAADSGCGTGPNDRAAGSSVAERRDHG